MSRWASAGAWLDVAGRVGFRTSVPGAQGTVLAGGIPWRTGEGLSWVGVE